MTDFARLPRRTFLKGVGTTMALPMLDAMVPSRSVLGAQVGKSKPPVRTAFVFFPNGAIPKTWQPKGEGTDWKPGKTLQPLAKLKDDLNVFSNLTQHHARPNGDGAGDHARNAGAFLTGAQPVKTAGADIKVGISVDQAAADDIGHLTKLPSLQLGVERGRNAGNCDSGYSCAYSSNISWRTPTTPTSKEINPKLVFERMFGPTGPGAAKARAEREFYRKSILDMVAADAKKLKKRLGRDDRQKIDEYFSSVRELEQRIERTATRPEEVPDFDVPAGIPRELAQHVRLMFDLMVLAFRTDSTRVITFMLANAGSNRTYPMVDVTDGHHQLSHHRGDESKIEKIQKIDRYLVEQYAYFIEQLKSVKEGDGTLLDNCMILYGSAISDGNRHNHDELPIVLAGRGGGTIQTGRHLVYPDETPLNNLYLSMLDRVGAQIESIGDSTGRLSRLDG